MQCRSPTLATTTTAHVKTASARRLEAATLSIVKRNQVLIPPHPLSSQFAKHVVRHNSFNTTTLLQSPKHDSRESIGAFLTPRPSHSSLVSQRQCTSSMCIVQPHLSHRVTYVLGSSARFTSSNSAHEAPGVARISASSIADSSAEFIPSPVKGATACAASPMSAIQSVGASDEHLTMAWKVISSSYHKNRDSSSDGGGN
jgi:hypothetical protein